MPWLTFDGLDAQQAAFDAAVARTPEIDHFCSALDWVQPARAAFAPEAQPFVRTEPGVGTVALMQIEVTGGRAVAPLEAGWGLAAPFAGPDAEGLMALLDAMLAEAEPAAHGVFLSGIVRGGALWTAALRRFGRRYRLGLGPPCDRRVADLAGGVDGFLGRRSAKFRAELRRAWRKAEAEGFRHQYLTRVADPAALFTRVMALEGASWKGLSGQGVNEGAAREFYRLMMPRLARRNALRAALITRDGQDVAFCVGGLFGPTYRGLQVSFDDRFRAFAPGNLAQFAMIQGLCREGVGVYDLGTDMPYKHRWSEPGLQTVTLSLVPSPGGWWARV
ncbi:MAG: GNAT family N-acetyltransferase [Myxococcales bacterium]|nr:GNAT family N-acetyltransferase [Myxococcales bacterium]MCB9525249.1 GNAT family N-acetyltransferase [Myxococcales bacterium]